MLATTGEAFSLFVVSRDVCSGEVFDEGFPPIIARLRDCNDLLLNRWLFFDAFLPLLDRWYHNVLDEDSG